MTYIEKFEHLKKTYGKKPDMSKLTEDFAAQITMTDDDCHGIFYVAYLNGVLAMEPYDYHDNTVAVTVNSGLLEEILKGKKDPAEAYNNGELQAQGNLMHALMMIGALKKEPARRKAPAKKAVEKAAEAVKEAAEEVKASPKAKKAAAKAEKAVEAVKEAAEEVKASPKAKKTAEKAEKAVEAVKEAAEEVKASPKAKKAAAKAEKAVEAVKEAVEEAKAAPKAKKAASKKEG